MNEKDTATILEALAEGIRSLQTEKFLKEMEIERLRARIAELETMLGERKDDKS